MFIVLKWGKSVILHLGWFETRASTLLSIKEDAFYGSGVCILVWKKSKMLSDKCNIRSIYQQAFCMKCLSYLAFSISRLFFHLCQKCGEIINTPRSTCRTERRRIAECLDNLACAHASFGFMVQVGKRTDTACDEHEKSLLNQTLEIHLNFNIWSKNIYTKSHPHAEMKKSAGFLPVNTVRKSAGPVANANISGSQNKACR